MTKKYITLFLVLFFGSSLFCQTYRYIPVKEEYDDWNTVEIDQHKPHQDHPTSDYSNYGDGMCKILEGYITMYKTTGDKAYLHKFVSQSMCMMENRHDVNSSASNSEARWTDSPEVVYPDGYIVASFARFVYLVKIEKTSLISRQLYPFSSYDKNNYAGGTWNCNNFNTTFSTFGQYANWLETKVKETLDWYVNNNYWDNAKGIMQYPNHYTGAAINMQVGYARAFFFIGLTANNTSYTSKAQVIANFYKSQLNLTSLCPPYSYSGPVLKSNTSNNSYWWYHRGWEVYNMTCAFPTLPFNNQQDITDYTILVDDMSHGEVVTWLPLDMYRFQAASSFSSTHMIRFRNMFTKSLYMGNGDFHNLNDSGDNPIPNYPCGTLSQPKKPCLINQFRNQCSALGYMPLYKFDGADATATTPNVYDIVFDFYQNYITGKTNQVWNNNTMPTDYGGQANKGHAEVVAAQWDKECPNLTLYNRSVVYDQDFLSKTTLTIAPEAKTGSSYADPIITTQTFTVEPNVSSTMTAGKSIVLKAGTKISANSHFKATIDINVCPVGSRSSGSNDGNIVQTSTGVDQKTQMEEPNEAISDKGEESAPTLQQKTSLAIFPNPTDDQAIIQFYLANAGSVSLKLLDGYGRVVLQEFEKEQLASGVFQRSIESSQLGKGVYYVMLLIDGKEQLLEKLVKK